MLRGVLIALACVLSVAALACGGPGVARVGVIALPQGAPANVYVALGDSIADGSGASDHEATDYVALVHAALRKRIDGLELVSLAKGGATTDDLIAEQLPRALELLRAGNVRLVTVTIGGNDLNQLQNSPNVQACLDDPASAACGLTDILVDVEGRLDTILRQLREAGPDATVAIEVYPNLFSGTGHRFEQPAETSFQMLDDVILRVAQRNDHIVVADPRAPFAGHGGTLTHTLDPTPDFHPNDGGYRIIADAFLTALGIDR